MKARAAKARVEVGRAWARRRGLVGVLARSVSVGAAIVTVFMGARADATVRARGVAVVGLQLEPPGLDPTAGPAAAIRDVTFQTVFEGLTQLEPGGRVSPLLAVRWSVSPDGRVLRFVLRPGVRFQDGAPLDAAAVKLTLDRDRAPSSTNAQRARLSVIDEVEAIGPLEIELRLKHPDALLPTVLAWGDAVILSPRRSSDPATSPVGTGPFRFIRWRRGESVELARNPTYWGTPPKLDRLVFRFITDPTAALAALDAGDVDAFPAFPSPEAVSRLRRDPRFAVRVAPTQAKTLLALNERRHPLDDVRVRRALSFAVDRKAVIDGAMYGFGEPIGSHFPPQNQGYVDLTGRYPYDPARARALLAQVGSPHPRLTLTLPPPAYARRAGEILAAELADVGVRVRVETLEWAPWLERVFGRHDFDMTVVAHVEPEDYDIYGRDDYYFGYRSARVRHDLAALDGPIAAAARLAALGDIQRTLAEDAANVFLFEYPAIGVWRTRLSGLWAPTPVRTFDYRAARAAGPAADPPAGAGDPPRFIGLALAIVAGAAMLFAARRADPRRIAVRALQLALTLLAASLIVFLAVQVAPGDPARTMLGMNADAATLHALRVDLGLDAPVPERYLRWIGGLSHGDFGSSFTYRTPVGALIAERLAVSAPLTLYALSLSTTMAVAIALASAARPERWIDRALGASTLLGLAVPNFWLGMMLILLFASGLHWLAAGGFPGWDAGVPAAIGALTLPALALAVPQAAVLARVLRAELISQLAAEYMLTVRAKGAGRWRLLVMHALPNALPAGLTILSLQFSFLLAGAVVIENVFDLPGLGRLIFQAIAERDLIVVQSAVIVLVAAVVIAAFVVDVATAAIDPRIASQPR